MNNLRADIAELFGELDGSQRYEDRLETWGADKRDAHREYDRNWKRTKYRLDPVWRKKIREHLGARRLASGIRPRTYGPVSIHHGTWYAYKRGCRCLSCRDASAAYQRGRRKRMAPIPTTQGAA